MTTARIFGAIFALGLLVGGLHLLREATESTHRPTDPASRLLVVVEAKKNRGEPTNTLADLTAAHLTYCQLEVATDEVGGLQPVPGAEDRFSIILQPALDSTDRKQYEGCVEDWNLDHSRVHIISMEDLPVEGGAT